MKKITLAIVLCIFGLLFFAPDFLENAEAVQAVAPSTLPLSTTYPSTTASGTFNITNPQDVYVQYGSNSISSYMGIGYYVKIKKTSTGTYISSATNIFYTFSTGTYGAINGQGFAKYTLTEAGQYTMEIYGGTISYGYGVVSATLKYLPYQGKLIRYLRTSPDPAQFTFPRNVPVHYAWSGRIYPGSLTGQPYFSITGTGTNISGGASATSGYFTAAKNVQYTVNCSGGYYQDYYGNRTDYPAYVDICYDDTEPIDSITLQTSNNLVEVGGVKYTASPVNLSWSNNPNPPASRTYQIRDSGTPIGYSTSQTSQQVTLGEGYHYLTVVSYDQWENETRQPTPTPTGIPLTIDNSPPSGSMVINGGAIYSKATVNLNLSGISDDNGVGVDKVSFSNDNITYSQPETCTGGAFTKSGWPLAQGPDGPRRVYVKFSDKLGNETSSQNAISDTITLDTTPPSGSFTINNGAGITGSIYVTLDLSSVSDAGSGLATMEFSNDGTNFTVPELNLTAKSWVLSPDDGIKTVYVKVTDNVGNTAIITDTIEYRNIIPGGELDPQYITTLPDNEVWDEDHPIYGQVIVPAGVHLTIAAGVKVTVTGPPESNPYLNGLIVEGTLTVENGASFTTPSPGWMGIIISGTAAVTGANISLAQRGLAILDDAVVTVNNTIFSNNIAGVQVYEANPTISDCSFLNNTGYGVKEDEGGSPVMIGCDFSGNGVDYYHQDLTMITMEHLNTIGTNHDNRKTD